MNTRLLSILVNAYKPCPEYFNVCKDMRWEPESGHVPRGFNGATGDLEEVELVLVFAEPGDPHKNESHTGIDTVIPYAIECFKIGKDQFHRNVRHVLDLCWPGETYDNQLRRVWMTESVLCSARREGGHVSMSIARACVRRYLLPQIKLLPNAVVAALGRKAQGRLQGVVDYYPAYAVAPPGCNKKEAKASWIELASVVKARSITRNNISIR